MSTRQVQRKGFLCLVARLGLEPLRYALGLFCLLVWSASASPYAGTYAGSYTGADSGTWRFTVSDTGRILGSAGISAIVGVVSDSGGITMGVASTGESFVGQIAANGNVSGTWKDVSHPSYSGSFWGKRTSQPTGGGQNGGAYAGVYRGTYGGSTSGNWQITVDASGTITGMAGGYAVSGLVSASGRVDMGIVSTGEVFVGQVSADGSVRGTWNDPHDSRNGTFQGRKDGQTTAAFEGAGTYDGYFYATDTFDGRDGVTTARGILSLKASSSGALTAKAVLQNGSPSLSAAGRASEADGTYRATLTARSGETFDLSMKGDRIWGELSNGVLGGGKLTLEGARNRFADLKDAEAQALLAERSGYYTVALPSFDAVSVSDQVNGAPLGVGYLAVTVGSKGSAKIAGVLADGTKVSMASRLILFGGSGPESCVPLFAPLYSKKGWIGGLLWLDQQKRTLVTERERGWTVRWEKPGVGPDGFSELLDVCGGYFGTGAALASGYLFGADAGDVPYVNAGAALEAVADAVPDGIGVTVSGTRLTIAKGSKPANVEGTYVYEGANPALATLAYTARTGLFRGKFSLFYDGEGVHKVVSVPYAGVLTPVRDEAFADLPAGLGHCLVPDNDPAVKAYKLKRSFPVWLEAE